MSDDIVIRVEGLWKRYGLPLPAVLRKGIRWLRAIRNPQSLAQSAPGRAAICNTDDGPWALRDINLEVNRGETLGIIGRNGAGKSTLLKILAGVTPPTRGRVEVQGPVFPMIELNAGLHMELTGRENVRLLGAIMGISKVDIEAKTPAIHHFTELGGWFDRPVRTYSSGMLARLGFGVAMNVEADIILVDEAFAVGDLGFQKKCYDKMSELQNLGRTLIVVSHSPYQLERMCSRVLLMEEGRRVKLLNPREVIVAYFDIVNRGDLKSEKERGNLTEELQGLSRAGSGTIRVTKVAVLDHQGTEVDRVEALKSMKIVIDFTAFESVSGCLFSIRIFSTTNVAITYLNTTMITEKMMFNGKHRITCTIPKVLLMSDTYSLEVKVASSVLLDLVRNAAQFKVIVTDPGAIHCSGNRGILITEAQWAFD